MGLPESLTYGPDPNQWAEFALPRARTAAPPVPLVVMVHGGFWHARYGSDHVRPLCAALRSDGWATLNLEYRRVGNPGGGWPATVADIDAGLHLVDRLVEVHAVDPARVVLAGHSAGAHLSLVVAGRTTARLAGVVAVAPVTDLVAAHEQRLSDRGTAAAEFMGSLPEQDPDAWAQASPIQQVPLPMPAIVVHGELDQNVPLDQSRSYVTAAAAAGAEVELRVVAAEDHFAILDRRTASFAALRQAVARLVA